MVAKYGFEVVDANRPVDVIFGDLQSRIAKSFGKSLPVAPDLTILKPKKPRRQGQKRAAIRRA
jgi:hypothetical protein